MLSEIRTVIARGRRTLIEDAVGVLVLFALLIGGLHLPLF